MTSHAILHRGITIATPAAGQQVEQHCAPGHTAIREEGDGYDRVVASHAETLWAAKAAAGFSAE